MTAIRDPARDVRPDLDGDPGRVTARRVGTMVASGIGMIIGLTCLTVATVLVRDAGTDLGFPVAVVLMLVTWLVAGWALVRQPGRGPLSGLVLAATVAATVGAVGRGSTGAGQSSTLAHLVQHLGRVGDALGSALLFHAGLGLPSGALVTTGRRVGATLGYGLAAVAAIVLVGAGTDVADWSGFLPVVTIVVAVLIGGWATYLRYLVARPIQRRRLQWLCAGGGLVILIGTVLVAANLLFEWPRPIGGLLVAASALVPLALATDRWHVAEVRAERTVTWVFVSIGVTLMIASTLIVFVLGLVHRPTGSERAVVAATLAAVLVVAAAMPVLRPWLSDLVTHVVRGDRHPPDDALHVLAARFSRAVTVEDLVRDVVDALAASQGTAGAELWQVEDGSVLTCTVATPRQSRGAITVDATTRLALVGRGVAGSDAAHLWLPSMDPGAPGDRFRLAPVSYAGELLGVVVVRRPADADDFSEEDQAILTETARQLGLVLHNAQLDSTLSDALEELSLQAAELRASRARIVAAADTERRHLERDLHDGAQQQLVALAVSLGVLRDVMTSDPTEAAQIVEELRAEVQVTIDGIRALAHGIYPPLLVSRGLGEALPAVTGKGPFAARRRVIVEGIGRYDPGVEAAVYFCCLEALQNAAKHAPDATVTMTLDARAGTLAFTIADDGPGFDVSVAPTGQGRINMADRIGAVGGTITWTSTVGGGTTVSGSVPIETDVGSVASDASIS